MIEPTKDDNNQLTWYILRQNIIKEQKTKQREENWQLVSLYSDTNNFIGPAIFESQKKARSYMKKYNDGLKARNDSNNTSSNNLNNK
ncbi:MAG: hypothetical protein ACJ71G_17140 [Nitrososphaeraceae archaeon]